MQLKSILLGTICTWIMCTLVPIQVASDHPAKNVRILEITKVELDTEGKVQIQYGDGKKYIAPKEDQQKENNVPVIAPDRQTVAWTVNFENCCTSYNIPLTLVVFRSGKIIQRIKPGLMIANWMFVDNGRRIGIYSNTVHGDFGPTYDLYDTTSGKRLKQIRGPLDEKSPLWAKQL